METTFFQRYSAAIKTQYRLMLLPSILPALAMMLACPVVFSLHNLNEFYSALVLERFLALSGIVLLVPVPMPEQTRPIFETVAGCYTPIVGVLVLRMALLVPLLPLVTGTVCRMMLAFGCSFPLLAWWFGSTTTGLVLGALGFFTFSITGNRITGYLVPILYYVLNTSLGSKVGRLYLFSLEYGSLTEKFWLLAASVFLMLGGFFSLQFKRQHGYAF